MNKRMQDILCKLMGTGTSFSRCSPTSVHVHKGNRLQLEAINQLVNLGVAVQTGTRCEGDVLVFESAYRHFAGAGVSERDGLD